MSETSSLAVWFQGSPVVLPVVVVVAILILYMARPVAHGVIRALANALRGMLEMGAQSITSAQEKLSTRNKDVLLAMGQTQTERLIEREFQRVNTVVSRDLSGYPALHRQLSEQIAKIDEDYRQSTDVPPTPPEWLKAVDTIARIPHKGDPFVGRILQDIDKTITNAHKGAMDEYRKASHQRHRLLDKMLPFWRRLDRTLDRVESTIKGLQDRSHVIDEHMTHYEQIQKRTDQAVRVLSSSAMTHFVTSALVLLIATLGAFINFHLIALPMSEMVGATSHVGPVKTSDVAALVIIFTEIAMGLFLMESLRITRLFPVISAMDDTMRRRMIWVSGGILFTLACVESSLAYMRDLLAADREALTQVLAGIQVQDPKLRWIPSVGQMVMGFLLPFALTFVAIPLESFIQSSRTVAGTLMEVTMRGLSATLHAIASGIDHIGVMFVHLYDVVIIVPLKLEQMFRRKGTVQGDVGSASAGSHLGA